MFVMALTLLGIYYYDWRINGILGAFFLQNQYTQSEFHHQMSIVDTYCKVSAEDGRMDGKVRNRV